MQYYAHYADVVKDAAFGMPLAPDVSEAIFSRDFTTLSLPTYMFLASIWNVFGMFWYVFAMFLIGFGMFLVCSW